MPPLQLHPRGTTEAGGSTILPSIHAKHEKCTLLSVMKATVRDRHGPGCAWVTGRMILAPGDLHEVSPAPVRGSHHGLNGVSLFRSKKTTSDDIQMAEIFWPLRLGLILHVLVRPAPCCGAVVHGGAAAAEPLG
ncbi:MAG: hypothetical protein C4346_11125, partial [Chloroflexota bacterium]